MKTTSPQDYDRHYFLHETQGACEFRQSRGEILGIKHARVLAILAPARGEKILDIGCGRGELVLHARKSGASAFGIDFSKDALRLASIKNSGRLAIARCTALPVKECSFDAAVLSDVIEHISAQEAALCLSAAHSALKSGGRLVVHTNNAHTVKAAEILGIIPGTRFGKNNPKKTRHVNFFSERGLKCTLEEADFSARAWSEKIDARRFAFAGGHTLIGVAVALGFGGDLFAIGVKK